MFRFILMDKWTDGQNFRPIRGKFRGVTISSRTDDQRPTTPVHIPIPYPFHTYTTTVSFMRIFPFKLDYQFITESANEMNNQDLELQQLGNHLLRWKAGQTDTRTDGQTIKKICRFAGHATKICGNKCAIFFSGSQV